MGRHRKSTDVSHKICTKCKVDKPIDEFYWNTTRKLYDSWCRKCHSKGAHNHRMSLPVEVRAKISRKQNLKSFFGLTLEAYDNLLKGQNGVCAICGLTESASNKKGGVRNLAVDHDKNTGKIRGLLCGRCNTGIGLLQHNTELLHKSIEYLKSK